MFHQRARRAELPAIRLHDLRHGWATLALQSGVHPKIVSQQLGHATVTLDIYSHVTPAVTSEAVGRVTAAVFASGGR
jgi:integrase